MTAWLRLRHLCFTGPEKPIANVEFEAGLNVIYGASDTGKSFVVETIDFMLGGKGPLSDIPERVGYDRIFLGVETSENASFTLTRATTGGQFQLYEGLHQSVPIGATATVLGQLHNAKKTANVSRFLLDKVGLDGKKVRWNADNETRGLSFRELSNLCLVTETEIQKKGSPIETGQVVSGTVEYSIFKLLLTGVDDSALVPASRVAAASQSRAGKVEVLDELIASCQQRITENGEDPQELASQLERLAASIAREQEALRVSEEQYQALLTRRNHLRQKVENGTDRHTEIDELLARFELLDKHYLSDLARLESIAEAGSLLAALSPQTCPLCGATPQEQHRDNDCDGNLETVVAAAGAESAKIVRLRGELAETVKQLRREAASFERLLPRLTEERERMEREVLQLRPGVAERRTTYTELVEERASAHGSLTIFAQLAELQGRRTALERTPEGEASAERAATDLSSSTLDLFARQVEALLKAWNFPESDRAHFEETDRDLVIQGKRRSSQGKGKRAITHAAFTIGLMDFCKAQGRQHPGFVVLDSPLLAYRAPEGPEDDLRGTDVQDKFYEYLAGASERQVIVVENTTPPDAIAERPATTFFSKNPHQGRYGFFPLPAGEGQKPSV
jgi:predicted nuclease with TOPRIM domain